jgi:O-antigen/teichoic acid export membrane protein
VGSSRVPAPAVEATGAAQPDLATSSDQSGRAPSLARSLSWSFSGNLIGKTGIVLFTLVAAASLTSENFGELVGLQAAALLAAAAWDLGLTTITTREIAAGHIDISSASRRLLRLRLETAPLGVVAFAFGIWLLGRAVSLDPAVVVTMGVLAVLVGVEVLLVAALDGMLDFRTSGMATGLGRWAALLATTAVLFFPGRALAVFAFALCLGELVAIAVASVRLGRARARERGERMPASVVLTHRAAMPFAANGLIQFAYNRFDVLVVAAISSAAIMAAYAPASRIQDAMLLIAATAASVTLPTAARLHTEETGSAGQSRAAWARITVVAVSASLALATFVWLVAGDVVPALLGQTYRGAVSPIRIIVWSVPLIAFNSVLAAVVNARRRPYYVTAAIAAAAATAMLLVVVLVPSLGADGAAIAATLREVPVALVLFVGARKTGLFDRHVTEPLDASVRGQRS